MCTACLLPDEKRRFIKREQHPSRPTQRQVVEALKLQIQTLWDSFRGVNGYFTEAKYAKEYECLQAALKIVRAS